LTESGMTTSSARKAWAAALMPIALHDLNNATQFLSMLHSITSSDPDSEILESSAGNLARTGEGVEDLGLLMAIISTVAGSDLLLERRSSRGVEVVLNAVQKLVRKEGGDVIFADDSNLVRTLGDGMSWELPWALGAAVWIVANAAPDGHVTTLSFDGESWHGQCGPCEELSKHSASVMELSPEITLTVTETNWSLRAPTIWIERASESL
jgi:hypothetical protein